MALSPSGPWLPPPVDTFDGRAFYAAKTTAGGSSASDSERRFLFGWNPTRQDETDAGAWQWGGNLIVHELWQQTNGTLAVREPESVTAAHDYPQPVTLTPALGECDVEGDSCDSCQCWC
jgi:beta-fructofuranosidase